MAKSLSSQMKKLKSQQVEQLQAQARENTTITRGSKREGMTTVKAGKPLDHEVKQSTAKSKNDLYVGQTFGISLGCTLNMGDYESFRIDCWLSDTVQEGETVEQAFLRVQGVLEQQVEEISAQYKG